MSLYVLDTDVLTLFEEGHPTVLERVRESADDELAITVLTVDEQLSGWYTQVRQAKHPTQLASAYSRLAKTVRFLSRTRILDFDKAAIRRCEEL